MGDLVEVVDVEGVVMDSNKVIHSPSSIIKAHRPHRLDWNTRASNSFQLCRRTISRFFFPGKKKKKERSLWAKAGKIARLTSSPAWSINVLIHTRRFATRANNK